MAENSKIIQTLSEKAAVDDELFRNLIYEPVKTVKLTHPEMTEKEAEDIANKAVELTHTIPGDEVISVFKQMIRNSIKAYNKTVTLNQVVFWLGIALLAVTFGFEIAGRVMGQDSWQNAATTGIVGAIGVGTLITSFVFGPLKGIQNSLGNLSQIEIAFLSFIDRRDAISAVSKPQNLNEAAKINTELSKATSETMELIEKYCEQHDKASTPNNNDQSAQPSKT